MTSVCSVPWYHYLGKQRGNLLERWWACRCYLHAPLLGLHVSYVASIAQVLVLVRH